jgi:hypothetical protein
MERPERQWEVDEAVLLDVLRAALTALERESVPVLVIGGIASASYGRPRWTHDVDLLVRPQHARWALAALDNAGFETEECDPFWLFKAVRDDVLVDLIFRCQGDIFLDDEMEARSRKADFYGVPVPLVPPEDLLVIKAVVHAEHSPRHWHDALALVARADLDWPYLLERARQGPRRILSLLLYAQSIDLSVPQDVLEELWAGIAPRRHRQGRVRRRREG